MRVEIGNSVCKLAEFTSAEFAEVRKLMSYTELLRTGRSFKPRYVRRYLIGKRGLFPTGLLYLLKQWAAKNKVRLDVVDARIVPKLKQLGLDTMFVSKPFEPYPEQLLAAKRAKQYSRGIITAPTGLGKSLIVAEIIEALQVPTLVVVPSLGLKRQLTTTLRELFGEYRVGPLQKKKRAFFVTVENVDAISFSPVAPGFDCIIIDEFHRSGAATYRKLNISAWSGVYHKFGLTATNFRSKSEERLLLESVLSQVICAISYEDSVKRARIVPMEAFYVDLPERKMKGKENRWQSVYSELIVNNPDLNALAASVLARLYASGISALALTKEIAHGADIQSRLLLDHGIEVPFAKGENDDNEAMLEAFNDLSEPILLGTEGVFGEGMDTKPCEWMLDLGGGKSKNRFMQKCGRAFRVFNHPDTGAKESCKVLLFRYGHNRFLKKHFAILKKILLEEYGIVPVKLDLELKSSK